MVSIDGFYFTYDTIIESLIIASGSKLTSFIIDAMSLPLWQVLHFITTYNDIQDRLNE